MGKKLAKAVCVFLALAGILAGCSSDRRKPDHRVTVPLSDKPILSTSAPTEGVAHTPVYATTFGDTVLLATYPVLVWEDFEEPDCPAREISKGGRIACGGEHEKEVPIVKVMVLEPLAPDATSEWFSGMTSLSLIQGIELLDVRYVTDMTGMFRDCNSLLELPDWYTEE